MGQTGNVSKVETCQQGGNIRLLEMPLMMVILLWERQLIRMVQGSLLWVDSSGRCFQRLGIPLVRHSGELQLSTGNAEGGLAGDTGAGNSTKRLRSQMSLVGDKLQLGREEHQKFQRRRAHFYLQQY